MRCLVVRPFVSLRGFAAAPLRPCRHGCRSGGVSWPAQAVSSASWESQTTQQQQSLAPGLYLVATPIGNLEDVTLRALRVLKTADRILCEDTRVTSKLLNHYGIRTPLESYHQHNERSKEAKVVSLLQQNAAIALVSDAGMPCVNDPGATLVAAAAEQGLPVIPIPGPSSVLAALVGSGLPTERFMFCGYTPPKTSARQKFFAELKGSQATLLFFCPPHGLLGTLEDAAATLGPLRRCCVARELTKLHEEFWRGSLEGALQEFTARGPRGEVTLVVEGAPQGSGSAVPEGPAGDEVILEALRRAVGEEGLSPSQAAKEVARRLDVGRKHVYALSLKL